MAENKDKKVLNVPHLRFPGFSGEWEKHPNNTLFKIISEKNKNREFSTVLSASQTDGMVLRDSLGIDIKYEEDSIKSYKIVRAGDYVAHLRSFQGGFAFSDKIGICSPAYTILRPSELISHGFLKPYFMSQRFINSLRIVTYGIRDGKSISVEEYMKLYTSLPKIDEQVRITKFLKLIDERIATQTKIIEKLESLICGIAQSITRQGKPNICIADCLECHSSTLQENAINESGRYPVYGANGIVGYLDDYCIKENAILIIKDGSGVGTVSFARGKYSVIGTLNYLTVKQGYSLPYLYFYLQVFNFEPYKTGMAIPHIYFKDYSKAKIYCPSLDVQDKMANSLAEIENKLNIEMILLDLWKKQKNYLLSCLFV